MLAEVPAENQIAAMNREIAKLPIELRGSVEVAALMAVKAQRLQMAGRDAASRYDMIQGIAAFAFGVLFAVIMVIVAVVIPNPSDFQYFVFRTLLALAAGGIAAFIPGFLNLQWDTRIRAGGALAVFVLVYMANPAQLVASIHH